MKRLITILFAWFVSSMLIAQNYAPFHAQYVNNSTYSINITLTSSDTIPLTDYGSIFSLCINATIQQPQENSFVRIVMEDLDGHDYLVAESDWFRNDTTTVNLSNYCEETAKLSGVAPVLLKCYVTNATLTLHSLQTANFPIISSPNLPNDSIKKLQVQNIVDRINTYNENHGKLWRAGVTQQSLLDFANQEDREESDTYIANIKYYAEGIYEIGETPLSQVPSSANSLCVPSFDWRHRHGKNWITPIRHQGKSGLCWAFAAVAATESLVNLYYNKKVNLDLSEMDVAYYSYAGNETDSIAIEDLYKYHYKKGGSPLRAINYIRVHGVVDENSFPFIDDSIPGLPAIRPTNYNELINILTTRIPIYYVTNQNIDTIKKELIAKGPLISGFNWHPTASTQRAHAMPLIGYGIIQEGDTLSYYGANAGEGQHGYVIPSNSEYIGKTYWIFKNSYGIDDGCYHDGYMYILFKNISNFNTVYCISNPTIASINYSDSDIAIEDLDGDGYYNWGIGLKPSHCPSWVPDEPDGDDSNPYIGSMDEFGYTEDINPDTVISVTFFTDSIISNNQHTTKNWIVSNNSTLTITSQVVMNRLFSITIESGSTLIVDGGCIRNAHIIAQPDSHIILNNGGSIITYTSDDFFLPIGAKLTINNGVIK